MSSAIMSPLTASDGGNIAVMDWPLDSDAQPRGTVLLVHGLGEHAARYGALALWLNGLGFAVRGYDLYGHGESDGVRGALPQQDRLLEDLADLVDSTRRIMSTGEPLILLGHSMGGVVVAYFVLQKIRQVDALVLSSPALDPGLGRWQQWLLGKLLRWMPQLRLPNGLPVEQLCHDPAVVAAYRADPLVHDRISVQLASWIASAGAACIAGAAQWCTPTLLLYAGADRLVDPKGSRAFAGAAPTHMVHSHCFGQMSHEIFNEPDREQVLNMLESWLRRFA